MVCADVSHSNSPPKGMYRDANITINYAVESVTFINQLMHPIITVIDVKILLYKSLKDTH